MKIMLVLYLLYPGEYTYEQVREVQVASFAECRQVKRELKQMMDLPEGFEYMTACYDYDLPDPPKGVWVSDTVRHREQVELRAAGKKRD